MTTEPRRITPDLTAAEAKQLAAELKQLIDRKREPWDPEIEQVRERLRKHYLKTIFDSHASTSNIAKLTETLGYLWLDTSHAVIQSYRNRLAQMDKLLADAPNAHKNKQHQQNGSSSKNVPGPTARRRHVHAFRSFLSSEEDFFRTLLSRLAKNLLPAEAAGLESLGIHSSQDTATASSNDEQDAAGPDELARRRSHAIALAHKALICYGDLARYRELFAELPRQHQKSKRKRDAANKKLKNWTRAAECYHQARLLVPDNGNPSNQLAVLAQYSDDHMSAVYHYYRALCVRLPFTAARSNLGLNYKKALQKWTSAGPPRGDEGYVFKVAFVALHGVFFTKTHIDLIPQLLKKVHDLFHIAVEERLLTSDAIVKTVVTSICALWDARMFRSAAKAASSKTAATSTGKTVNLEPQILIHILKLYETLLSVGTIETEELFAINHPDLTLGPDADLSANLSAVLRRALPALRILSKFIMSQLDYISRIEARLESRENKLGDVATGNAGTADQTTQTDLAGVKHADLLRTLKRMWTAYARFTNSLGRAFPVDRITRTLNEGVWLEEDVDMLGFSPLRRSMKNDRESSTAAAGGANGSTTADGNGSERIQRVGRDVHPNEEQLMRIAVLQADARLIADSEASYIKFESQECVVEAFALESDDEGDERDVEDDSPEAREKREVAAATRRLARAFGTKSRRGAATDEPEKVDENDTDDDDDDDGAQVDTTEDDPVDLAMRVSAIDEMDDEEEEDDDEEIVYRSSASLQPDAKRQQTSPGTAQPPGPAAAQGQPQRAGDLLLNILNSGTSTGTPKGSPHLASSSRLVSASASTPNAVSSAANAMPGRSIWTPVGGGLPPASARAMASFEAIPNVTTHHESRFGAIGPSHQSSPSLGSHHPMHQQQQQQAAGAPSGLHATAQPFSPSSPRFSRPPGLDTNATPFADTVGPYKSFNPDATATSSPKQQQQRPLSFETARFG